MAAHNAFDRLWRSGRMGRRAAYRWLRERFGLPESEAHIGMMAGAMARKVEAAALELLEEGRRPRHG